MAREQGLGASADGIRQTAAGNSGGPLGRAHGKYAVFRLYRNAHQLSQAKNTRQLG